MIPTSYAYGYVWSSVIKLCTCNNLWVIGHFQVSAQAEKIRRARLEGNKEYVESESQQESDPAAPFEEVRKNCYPERFAEHSWQEQKE